MISNSQCRSWPLKNLQGEEPIFYLHFLDAKVRRPMDASRQLIGDSLVEWARPLIDSALQSRNFSQLPDRRLEGNFDHQEMAGTVTCAGACTRHSAERRPKMNQH